jgi:hypothetical protein
MRDLITQLKLPINEFGAASSQGDPRQMGGVRRCAAGDERHPGGLSAWK